MRKTRWVSFAITLFFAALFLFLEQRRGYYYLHTPTPALSKNDLRQRLDHALASFMQKAEWAASDARFRLRGNRPPDPNIAIIAIDEKSLDVLHQWPWPRSIHAQLIRTLQAHPPKALIFDVLFIEPFSADPSGDRSLVDATRRNPWVVHSLFFELQGDEIKGVKLPFSSLLHNAANLGYVNAFIDDDGVLRSAHPTQSVGGQTIPLISVAGASLYLGKSPEELLKSVPLDERGRLVVNYVGKAYTFPYLSYADVLTGKIPADQLAGRILLVGSSATGTFDHYPTPLSGFMPGVEFHANVIDNLLHWNDLRYVGLPLTYAAIIVFALLCGFLLVRFSAWEGAVWTLLVVLAYAGTAQVVFVRNHLLVDMAGPVLTLLCGYVAIVIYRFFTEEREKRLVRSYFSQQVSGELLDMLMQNPEILKKPGERREMTAFFSDVAGFTSISERLEPEELVTLLNQYLTVMTEVIFKQGGYVDKYMGDGIMAFWNGLLKQPDHAERACRCALESKRELQALNHRLEKEGLALQARIGINTGTMAAGYMGSAQKRQYTIMGDNVNLASRLEGANKSFGTAIMISEFTYQFVQDQFDVRFLDIIRVPGKAKPVKTYELLGEKGSLTENWARALPLYHEAIQEFGGRNFEKARINFLEVLKILGHDKPCETYIHRAEAFVAQPPPEDWDGVFELKTK